MCEKLEKKELNRIRRNTLREYLEKVTYFSRRCKQCGIADIWDYGMARTLGLCRPCYRSDISKIVDEFDSIKEKYTSRRREKLEWNRFQRQYYRKERIKNGIFEPIIKCRKCKEEKPLFEFPGCQYEVFKKYSDLNRLLCYNCLSIMRETKICPTCRERREEEDFEDLDYKYRSCSTCRDKWKEERMAREKLYYAKVATWQCRQSLSMRNLEETDESLAFIGELILAKRRNNRIKQILKEKINESSNANV